MNSLNVLLSEYSNPEYYTHSLPQLGPLQMVCDYTRGGLQISTSPALSHTIGQVKQFAPSSQIALTNDGKLAVLNTDDKRVYFYKTDGTLVESVAFDYTAPSPGFAIGKDKNFYFSAEQVNVYKGANRKFMLGAPSTPNSRIAFANDGKFLLASKTYRMQLQLFDQNCTLLAAKDLYNLRFENLQDSDPTAVAYDSSTDTFAVAVLKTHGFSSQSQIATFRYNEKTKSLDYVRTIRFNEPSCCVDSLCFDVTGNLLVACGHLGVRIYKVGKNCINHFPALQNLCASSIAIDQEGQIFVFDQNSCRVLVYK